MAEPPAKRRQVSHPSAGHARSPLQPINTSDASPCKLSGKLNHVVHYNPETQRLPIAIQRAKQPYDILVNCIGAWAEQLSPLLHPGLYIEFEEEGAHYLHDKQLQVHLTGKAFPRDRKYIELEFQEGVIVYTTEARIRLVISSGALLGFAALAQAHHRAQAMNATPKPTRLCPLLPALSPTRLLFPLDMLRLCLTKPLRCLSNRHSPPLRKLSPCPTRSSSDLVNR